MVQYLPKTHRILEREFMEFRPFGKEINGETIRDLSGVSIRSNVEYLEELATRTHGKQAGQQRVGELVKRLNDRIPDRAYHVSAEFLKNPWTGYSNEFVAYLVEFCIELSEDPEFQLHMGREKLIPPIIQTLMRPFSVRQIYQMAAYWAQHYCRNSYSLEGIKVIESSGVLRMNLTERAYTQFGPYRKACARLWCQALKTGISVVPEKVHHLGEAKIKDKFCIAEGDQYCEWEVSWAGPTSYGPAKRFYLKVARNAIKKEIEDRERVIDEQMRSLEVRHEELHKAYVDQQQNAAELQRKVDQLTTLYDAGLAFTSTLDQEILLGRALNTIIQKLHYDRAMISHYDSERKIAHGARMVGVSQDIADFAMNLEVPVTDPSTVEGTVILEGKPILVGDISEVWDRMHPLNRELSLKTNTRSFISVPLKVTERVIGTLTVDQNQSHALSQDDLNVMVTVANQVAIALDNAEAYRQIEELILGLSHVSHDLRNPPAAIKGLVSNLLDGLVGPLTSKQVKYLALINNNAERMTRMIGDLLDLSRISAGKVTLVSQTLDLSRLISEVVEQLQFQIQSKEQQLEFQEPKESILVVADRDRLFQVFVNLIDNAIKFTSEGGHIIVKVDKTDENDSVVSITDFGPGISTEDISRLFNPFFQAHPQHREGSKGLGLGLAIVKNLVTLHGGKVLVNSEVGKGTTFSVLLPPCIGPQAKS